MPVCVLYDVIKKMGGNKLFLAILGIHPCGIVKFKYHYNSCLELIMIIPQTSHSTYYANPSAKEHSQMTYRTQPSRPSCDTKSHYSALSAYEQQIEDEFFFCSV